MTTDRHDRASYPRYVFVTLPTCPKCGADKHDTRRTDRGGDGSKTHHAKCRACGFLFRIVWEREA